MLTVKVVRPFKRRGRILTPGAVLTIEPAALAKLAGYVEPLDLHRMVGEALAEVDRQGRPWPLRFLADLPQADRDKLRELEREIDAAVIAGEAVKLAGLLDAWRALLMLHIH